MNDRSRDEIRKPGHRRLVQAAWFVGLWLAGVGAVTAVAWLIRWWLFGA